MASKSELEEPWALELQTLLAGRRVAALGTLHDGEPYVSMVPFALAPNGSAFLIHVSGLSAHTEDMLANPHVALLVMEVEKPDVMAQELARVTVLGTASQIPEPSPEYDAGKERYLERFPDAEPMFNLGDFSLFAIQPTHVRWIGGFAGAQTLDVETFKKIARGAAGDIG
jgi:putative heme iron utilization protein